jgi:hypothetical protein
MSSGNQDKVEGRDNEKVTRSADLLTDEERREFIKSCGRFGAYVAPVMVTLLSHRDSSAQAISGKKK